MGVKSFRNEAPEHELQNAHGWLEPEHDSIDFVG